MIDVEEMSADPSPKRRKISVSASGAVRACVPQIDASVSAATAGQSSRITGGVVGKADVSYDPSATIHKSNGDNSGGLVEVVVEGCGLEEVNGAYKRDATQSSPVFRKSVQRKRKTKDSKIVRGCHSWFINSNTNIKGSSMFMYSTQTERISEMPPKNGWNKMALGILPTPTCRVIP